MRLSSIPPLLDSRGPRGRQAVESTRRLLKLPVSSGTVPAGAETGIAGMTPWRVPNQEFYRIDTALVVPAVDPGEWKLRIHGLVDREVTITYAELLKRQLTETWVTICCVSNPVGGDLIGNAWWSGVRIADLLKEAGVKPEADAVKQTSKDGWTCGTPIEALTDGRDALLAVGMNGGPLPIDHGFPVRMIVPGLYGYVSATKWLVDLELTTFESYDPYWVQRGWTRDGPIKTMARIDSPKPLARVSAGTVAVAGVAWAQHHGIDGVEVRIDGGHWQAARMAAVDTIDTWRQWVLEWDAPAGNHTIEARATDATGGTQTEARAEPFPNGATGWHSVVMTVT